MLRYNLFRGGGDIAREREAFLRVKEARENLRVAQRDAEQEARVAYHALTTARARLEALSDGVDAQRSTRDIYAQQFDLGQRGLLDLLDAENELFIDRSNLVTATFTETFAVYRVLAVVGAMLDSLEIDRPAQAINIYRDREQQLYGPAPVPRAQLRSVGSQPLDLAAQRGRALPAGRRRIGVLARALRGRLRHP